MSTPHYNDDGYFGPASPPYSASVTDGERILELRPSQATAPTNLPTQYLFQSTSIKLDLGARLWPVSTPCFGYKGVVEGEVSVTTIEHVKRIVVTVEATIKSLLMERGPGGHIGAVLFQRSVTLYTNNPRSSQVALSYPFSIVFPTTCDGSSNPLPPSFERRLPGSSTEIQYCIRIDMSRSGLRRRESLAVPILYLPRSHLSPNPWGTPPTGDQAHFSPEGQGMAEFHLVPEFVALPLKGAKSEAPSITDIQAKIALPSPLVVVSGDRIPFVITIDSRSQALAAFYNDITLQLIKFTVVKVYQNSSSRKEVLGSGEVYHSEESGGGMRVLHGELRCGNPGAELSWSAKGIVEVRHVIRLALKPPSNGIALSANLPVFERMIPIEVMTHHYSPNVDVTAPALGLLSLNIL